ncbi:BMP family protein [Pimelobacter simplex]|uniref:Nucleoside ABC transporter, periplasmic nucleoside-binding protein n=2 Tax=Nocardioides simplex TaxID=2045 RepID=A0A0A1DML5_NOCSI|nr:BMP family ABC transporter substrate-binding protein [Pimelobacter simplex]AIY16620.1 Nucleoside ABC transporter, periplasmic nucleoside-binding protein [Pimelobacter simplex]GEB15438.1 BMP family ABC transporter substrate-binding protein [Pimelobacter simplex]SFN15110.1 nucleoside-binding protein [Pimelobacter simplex]
MKTWKRTSAVAAVAIMASAALAACGDAPEKSADKKSDFLPCILSDAGGFDDKSFNQLSYEGVKDAAKELNSDYKEFESKNENDYAPALDQFVNQGCDAIVTVGFALSAATVESAKANPDIEYILIDDAADNDFDGKKDADNIKPILYDTAQAAFLAGYAAADYTKTGVVGTYGGQPFPTVTIFMDGFKQGVDYYAKEKGKSVKLVGWEGNDKGVFTGGFDANEKATNTAKQILDQNADVILPVGGPIYQGALTAIKDSGKDVAMIGVDADFYETDPTTRDLIFTSILKNMKTSTIEAVVAAGNDKFDPEAYIGTLENDGVGIAPFHNFESKISPDLQGELDTVKAGIIDGSIPVSSYLTK